MKIAGIEFIPTKRTTISLIELKKVLISYYGYKLNDINLSRELIITEVLDNHSCLSSIVFSINGSPPKGIGFLLVNDDYNDRYEGTLLLYGNGKFSHPIQNITILK